VPLNKEQCNRPACIDYKGRYRRITNPSSTNKSVTITCLITQSSDSIDDVGQAIKYSMLFFVPGLLELQNLFHLPEQST